MSVLVGIIKKYYEENSRFQCGPPPKLMRELHHGRLVLSDYEIGDEDIAVLIRFFYNKKAWENIRRIEVNRYSGGKVNQRGTTSALNMNNSKLLKELIIFISKCEKLEILSFEHISMSEILFGFLGKALASGCSELRWLLFRSCEFEGDKGLKTITPFLGKLSLELLAFEYCQLTDQSFVYLISILKAQEINLDALYWNCTLRLTQEDLQHLNHTDEINAIYSQGLSGLSLVGNEFTGKGILSLARVIKKSNWLLGISLAANKLDEVNTAIFVDEVKENSLLQTVLLGNNPGYTASTAQILHSAIVNRNASHRPENGLLSGFERLSVLPPRLCWLMKTWMRLQSEELQSLIEEQLSPAPTTHQLIASHNTSALSITSHFSKSQYQISSQELMKQQQRKLYSAFGFLEDHEKPEAENQRNNVDKRSILYDLDDGEKGEEDDLVQIQRNGDSVSHYDFDDINHAVPMRSPVHEPSNDLWEYWEAKEGRKQSLRNSITHTRSISHDQSRPPSRISIRPRSTELDYHTQNHSRSYTPSRVRSSLVVGESHDKLPRYMLPKDVPLSHYEASAISSSMRRSYSDNGITRRCQDHTTSHSNGNAERNMPCELKQSQRPAWIPSSAFASSQTPSPTRRRPHSTDGTIPYASCRVASHSQELMHGDMKTKKKKQKKSNKSIIDDHYHSHNAEKRPQKTAMRKKRIAQKEMRPNHDTNPNQNSKFMEEISSSVLLATKNLEQISRHLRDVAESLSESALLNLTNDQQQSRLYHDALIHHSGINNGVDNSASQPNLTIISATDDQYDVGKNKYEDLSGENDLIQHTDGQQLAIQHPESTSPPAVEISQLSEFTSDDLQYLADLVRDRMRIKLRSLLEDQLAE